MKNLLLFIILAAASPMWAGTWALVQHPQIATCTSTATSCTLTVTATGANHLLVAFVAGSGSDTLSSVTGGGTWTIGCQQTANMTAYVLSSTAGATSITANISVAPGFAWSVSFREYSTTTDGILFDGCANQPDSSCTACATPTLTLTGANDAVIATATTANAFTTVNSPYANLDTPNGNGIADHLNTGSGAGATFNQSAAAGSGTVTMAFKEFTDRRSGIY